jgi:hypothetical protein
VDRCKFARIIQSKAGYITVTREVQYIY